VGRGKAARIMRIVFMGTPESALASLRRLIDDGHEIVSVWTQPDKPAGRHHQLRAAPVKEFAQARGLPVHQLAKINNDEAKTLFASHNAETAVVVAYGKILPAEYLSAPGHGCINLHFSLLPKYRGAAPVNWAIVNGEKETGVTTMKIVQELDAGPILLQRSTDIAENETAPELMNRLANIGAELVSETLNRIETIKPQPQRDEEATFAPILKRADGLVDWTMDAFAIERRVRGFQPWPGAFALHGSHRVIIWNAAAERVHSPAEQPGQIVEATGERLLIACGKASALRILSAQQEGKRRMNVREFLNGARLIQGEILGGT